MPGRCGCTWQIPTSCEHYGTVIAAQAGSEFGPSERPPLVAQRNRRRRGNLSLARHPGARAVDRDGPRLAARGRPRARWQPVLLEAPPSSTDWLLLTIRPALTIPFHPDRPAELSIRCRPRALAVIVEVGHPDHASTALISCRRSLVCPVSPHRNAGARAVPGHTRQLCH